jgi:hypothetical protein
MGVRGIFSEDESSPLAHLQSEYQEMLAQRPLEELTAIARTRRIEVHAHSRQSAVQELASRLCDLGETSAQLGRIHPLGLRMLLYLHLVLTPGRGLSAGNTLRECAVRLDSPYLDPSCQRTSAAGESDLVLLEQENIGDLSYARDDLEQRESRRHISAQLASLSERGLILPFKQHNATYYSIPLAVRACLPPQLCLPAATFSEENPKVRETTYSQIVDELYAFWATVASRIALGRAIILPPLPARQPIEEQWAALEGWRHIPSELASLGRSKAPAQMSAIGSPSLTQSLTVPPADYYLQDADRLSLRSATRCAVEQIEFYLHLLHALGALQLQPKEPVGIFADRMQIFLSLHKKKQISEIFHSWILIGAKWISFSAKPPRHHWKEKRSLCACGAA